MVLLCLSSSGALPPCCWWRRRAVASMPGTCAAINLLSVFHQTLIRCTTPAPLTFCKLQLMKIMLFGAVPSVLDLHIGICLWQVQCATACFALCRSRCLLFCTIVSCGTSVRIMCLLHLLQCHLQLSLTSHLKLHGVFWGLNENTCFVDRTSACVHSLGLQCRGWCKD